MAKKNCQHQWLFFWTNFDKYYYEDIKYTMEELEKLLAKLKRMKLALMYHLNTKVVE